MPLVAPHAFRRLPFAHLNLTRNPFGELDRDERAALAVTDTGQYVELLLSSNQAVQFLGDKGRGKTTHLLAIASHFTNAAYVHLPEDGLLPPLPTGNPLLIDEAQRLPARLRRQAFDGRTALVLGSHADHAEELRRAGYRVQTVEVAATMCAERLHDILNRRILASRRGLGGVPAVCIESAERLLLEFRGDVRGIMNHLYDLFQDLEGPCDV